jgi:hypothetical protein
LQDVASLAESLKGPSFEQGKLGRRRVVARFAHS